MDNANEVVPYAFVLILDVVRNLHRSRFLSQGKVKVVAWNTGADDLDNVQPVEIVTIDMNWVLRFCRAKKHYALMVSEVVYASAPARTLCFATGRGPSSEERKSGYQLRGFQEATPRS